VKDRWDAHRTELAKRQGTVERLASKHHATLVRFQRAFDEAAKRAPADYWIWDGVHPTYCGHQVMADEWERAVARTDRRDSMGAPGLRGSVTADASPNDDDAVWSDPSSCRRGPAHTR
jgi:hypothetical protein